MIAVSLSGFFHLSFFLNPLPGLSHVKLIVKPCINNWFTYLSLLLAREALLARINTVRCWYTVHAQLNQHLLVQPIRAELRSDRETGIGRNY